jgi:hypothetical protein
VNSYFGFVDFYLFLYIGIVLGLVVDCKRKINILSLIVGFLVKNKIKSPFDLER